MHDTRLYLVRHGETVWNAEGRVQGIKDSPLTDRGISHAKQTGDRIRSLNINISQIYTSDLGRAVSTAGYIGQSLGLNLIKDSRLRERNMGIFEGKSWEYIKKNHADEFQKTISDNDSYIIPDGESRGRYASKVASFLDYVKTECEGKNILAVSHRGFINFSIRNILGIPLDAKSGFEIKNTTMTLFVLKKGIWMLESFGGIT